MPEWLVLAIALALFVLVSSWIGRRLLDPPVAWIRGILCSAVVAVASAPLALWVLHEAEVIEGTRLEVDTVAGAAFIVVVFAWLVAIALIVMIVIELLIPTRPRRNPVAVVQEWIRRRDRARRYAQIAAIASKHGLGAYRHRAGGPAEFSGALVAAMDEAGVTFVKAGQVLSARDDVLPREVTDALATLQTESSPIPWERARAAIEAQLGRPLDEVFESIDDVPLAAASVAQVHAARLRSGEDVVVKIQRPDARAQVATDLDILERLAADAERHTTWGKDFGLRALAAEFSRALREELDYRIEVANTQMLRGAIERTGSTLVRVPRVYPELCTGQMIVQERAEGVPFTRLPAGALPPDQAERIADGLLDCVFEQLAVYGVFHADLHAGNMILDAAAAGEDALPGTVTLIDFGAVGVLEKSLRRLLLPLLVAVFNEDDVTATDILLMIVTPPDGGFDERLLQHDVGVNLTRVHNSGADSNVLRALLDVMRRHRLGVPPSLLLAFRTLGSLEGALRRIAPGYDMIGRALERSPAIAMRAGNLRSTALTAQTQLALMSERLRRAPRRLDAIMRRLEEGTLSVRVRALDTPSERGWVGALLGQATATFVGVALIVVGILLASADGPAVTGDVDVFPFVGSVVGLAGLLLLLRGVRAALAGRAERVPDR